MAPSIIQDGVWSSIYSTCKYSNFLLVFYFDLSLKYDKEHNERITKNGTNFGNSVPVILKWREVNRYSRPQQDVDYSWNNNVIFIRGSYVPSVTSWRFENVLIWILAIILRQMNKRTWYLWQFHFIPFFLFCATRFQIFFTMNVGNISCCTQIWSVPFIWYSVNCDERSKWSLSFFANASCIVKKKIRRISSHTINTFPTSKKVFFPTTHVKVVTAIILCT